MNTLHLAHRASHESTATSPLQVKMFVHDQPQEAEAALARWLAQHPVNIHHVAQSQSEKGGRFVFVITIFYAEDD